MDNICMKKIDDCLLKIKTYLVENEIGCKNKIKNTKNTEKTANIKNTNNTVNTNIINNSNLKSQKITSIAKDLFWCFHESKTLNHIDDIFTHIKNTQKSDDRIRFVEGNTWEQLEKLFNKSTTLSDYKMIKSIKRLFFLISELEPNGLNTSPNAKCGKFELFYRILIPKSRQPNKGDITIDNKVIEIKGKRSVRISGEITGKEYRRNNNTIFKGHIQPNKITSGSCKGQTAFEIEKLKHLEHYKPQFDKDKKQSKKLLKQYLDVNNFSHYTQLDLNQLIDNGFDIHKLQQIQLKSFFNEYKKRCKWDSIVFCGSGKNVKVLEKDTDLKNFSITSDYFRIAQTYKIGWYIEPK